MRWTRDQYLDLMTFRSAPRPMFVELFGPLIGLEREWRAQGASPDEVALTAFDWDFVDIVGCGGHTGPIGPPPVVLEETDEMQVSRDMFGRTMRLPKRTATIALPLDFPVKTMDDWLRLKPMFAFQPGRIDWPAVERARAAQAQGSVVVAGIPGGFDMARELMGEEMACLAYYDQPELMADILQTLGDTALHVLGPINAVLRIDQLSVHEDFAGRSGPLIGPTQVREYLRPYYRRIWDPLAARGARIFQLDSDGNINSVIEDLLACGLTSLFPMEPAAGMDIVALRKAYDRRLAMLGGIDKHVLRQSPGAIRRELEYKMQPLLARTGGIVFGLDHRIPNGTPLENYRYYVATGREILGLPPLSDQRGWKRMAF